MRRPETTPARAAKKHMSKINTYTRQLARELTLEQAEAFLRQALPSSDIAQAGGDMPRRVAAQALKVRDWAPWGGSIPQDIFKAWVLFPRVNNEYWEEDRAWLWERVSPGLERLPMDQAAEQMKQAIYKTVRRYTDVGEILGALRAMDLEEDLFDCISEFLA